MKAIINHAVNVDDFIKILKRKGNSLRRHVVISDNRELNLNVINSTLDCLRFHEELLKADSNDVIAILKGLQDFNGIVAVDNHASNAEPFSQILLSAGFEVYLLDL